MKDFEKIVKVFLLTLNNKNIEKDENKNKFELIAER